MRKFILIGFSSVFCFFACGKESVKPACPQKTVPLIFIHHSCGENWLSDENGGLGKALARNNYYVSDTNYGWGPDGIGDRTDITNWTEWFTGPNNSRILAALYKEKGTRSHYSKLKAELKGENEIIIFKSCFPNSDLTGRPNDPPEKGQGLSIGNAKAIYNQLLNYFKTRPDKLFIAITAPPLQDSQNAKNARAFNRWLVNDWLAKYNGKNVAVFDFFNILTAPDNHHQYRDGKIEYITDTGKDILFYPSEDTHPSPVGNRKATKEFIPLLNYYYQCWQKSNPPDSSSVVKKIKKDRVVKPEKKKKDDEITDKNLETARASGVFDNFEGSLEGWEVFKDGEKPGSVTKFLRNSATASSGNASLEITYYIVPDSYGTCAKTYSSPKDWSSSKGINLSVFSKDVGSEIGVVVYQGKTTDELHLFENRFKILPGYNGKWQNIKIPWELFKQPDWQGDPSVKFNPKQAMGMAIIHHSGNKRRIGKTLIDDIKFLSK